MLGLLGCTQKKTLSKVQLTSEKKIKVVAEEPVISGPQLPQNQKTLKDETSRYGLEGMKATHFYAVDLNQDGYSDLVLLPEFYSAPKFLLYDTKAKKFIPWQGSPFDQLVKASFLEFSDYNRDGIVDVLVLSLNQRSALKAEAPRLFMGELKEKRLHFKLHPYQFPLDSYSAVSVFDYNNDGRLDIYFANWFDVRKSPPELRPNRFFSAVKSKEPGNYGFTFNEISDQFQGEWEQEGSPKSFVNARPTFGTSLCDLNFDGRTEIINANTTGYENRVWNLSKIEGREVYTDIAKGTQLAGDRIGSHLPQGSGHTFYLNCHDYNQDGFFDLSVGELFHSYDLDIKDRSSILTGNGDKIPYQFFRTEYHHDDGTEAWDQGDRRSLWTDLNADGLSDLIIDNSGFPPKSRLVVFRQHEDRSYEDVSKAWGLDHVNPSGTILLDVDKDGVPELLSGQTNIRDSHIKNRVYFYKNYARPKGQALVLSFDEFSRGRAIEVKFSNGLIQRFIVEATNGPQSSQSENKLFIYTPANVKFDSLQTPVFAGPVRRFKLKKFHRQQLLQLSLCRGKFQKSDCLKK